MKLALLKNPEYEITEDMINERDALLLTLRNQVNPEFRQALYEEFWKLEELTEAIDGLLNLSTHNQ